MAYADTTPVGGLLRTPTANAGGLERLIAGSGVQVQVVEWIFKQVTGRSLVQTIIEPITGDWSRIAANGEAWRSAGQAMLAISENLSANLPELREHWSGAASDSFGTHIDQVWHDALQAQSELAEVVGRGFDTVAEEGRRLCQEAIKELEKLVNKLIEAIAVIWVPFAGWARAVQMVWDAFQLFEAIMEIIQAVRGIIEAAQNLFDAVSQIRSALEAIPDVRNLDDAVAVATRLADGVHDATRAVEDIGRTVDRAQDGLDAARAASAGPASGSAM